MTATISVLFKCKTCGDKQQKVHKGFLTEVKPSGLLASFPGPAELSVTSSTVKWAGPGYKATSLSKLPLS